jgi:membrane peptidoglycan carboxypeptidase
LISTVIVSVVPLLKRRSRDHHAFTSVGALLICGLLAGVVVAAASFPAVAMSGLFAKAGSQEFASLPSELKVQTSPQFSQIFASDGRTLIAVMYDELRRDVALKDIGKPMQDAIVAAEDRKFYEHNGVDFKGVARAFVNNNQGSNDGQQGASTLTMQVVRMSQLYSPIPQEVVDATEKSSKRKINEMKYALQLEKEMSKQQILERYLNMAPFGHGAYGVFAASQVYFGKKPTDLTVGQAATLASLVKGPTLYDPTSADGNKLLLARRDWVLDGMQAAGTATAADVAKAKKAKIARTVKNVGNGCVETRKNEWGFFCDYFYRWWLNQSAFGKNTYERERLLKSGGYRVVTSLDVNAQHDARQRISQVTNDNDRNALVLAGIEPKTGRVRTLAANRKFGLPTPKHRNPLSSDPALAARGIRATYPQTTNPIITGGPGISGYQAGSVFKMFTMVAALESGMGLDTTIDAPQRYISPHYLDGSAPPECHGHYCPTNASDDEAGKYNMWTGFGNSVNTYFVPLEEKVGAEKAVDVARRFGVGFRSDHDADLANKYAHDWGSFTLGVSASTPLDIANAYATLAGDGMYCTPTPIQSITTHEGRKVDVGQPHCTRATTPDVARKALDAARCPVGDHAQLGSCSGATSPGARSAVGHPIFGKTGTTDSDKTAALVVGTQSLVIAGYLVNPDWAGHPDHMSHDVVNPAVWNTMADYMRGKPVEEFLTPE